MEAGFLSRTRGNVSPESLEGKMLKNYRANWTRTTLNGTRSVQPEDFGNVTLSSNGLFSASLPSS